ncbi:MAG: pentapeptide repeat-containing protein [Prochlorothrix sp.]
MLGLKNLRGANFAGSQFQGTNFAWANLMGANLGKITTELPRRWVLIQLITGIRHHHHC